MIDMHDELLNAHWLDQFSWDGLSVARLAVRYKCEPSQVSLAMAEIEKSYPKPKSTQTWKDIAFRKPCRTCGRVIGFAWTAKGKLMPVNLDDFTTHWNCEKPGKAKKRKEGKE